MQAADIAAIIAVQRESFPEHLRESAAVFANRFERFGEHFLVVRETGGEIVGYALSFPWQLGDFPAADTPFPAELPAPECFFLHDITLLPACRGRGAAAALLEQIFARGRELGFASITLVSVSQAGNFWDRQGFSHCDSLPAHTQSYLLQNYGQGARLMSRPL